AKLILREVGVLQIDWDDPVPTDVNEKWRNFRIEMTALREIRVPRRISWKRVLQLKLQGFADASSLWRMLEKAITTPRAELLAAMLLARMVVKFLNTTELKFESVHRWSDSKIVLAWFKKPSELLQTYVSNRVSEIQQLSQLYPRHFISTYDNSADLISRGVTPKKLIRSTMWWQTSPSHTIVED
uniref:Uncharacterized protein n=1 Tax=Anopheles christyi TaxID=43041 RepID=A0A182KCX1_9DIPT